MWHKSVLEKTSKFQVLTFIWARELCSGPAQQVRAGGRRQSSAETQILWARASHSELGQFLWENHINSDLTGKKNTGPAARPGPQARLRFEAVRGTRTRSVGIESRAGRIDTDRMAVAGKNSSTFIICRAARRATWSDSEIGDKLERTGPPDGGPARHGRLIRAARRRVSAVRTERRDETAGIRPVQH